MIVTVYLNLFTELRLRKIVDEGPYRDIEQLCNEQIEELALQYFRHRDDDPGRQSDPPSHHSR
jgi:hypothetical protein